MTTTSDRNTLLVSKFDLERIAVILLDEAVAIDFRSRVLVDQVEALHLARLESTACRLAAAKLRALAEKK